MYRVLERIADYVAQTLALAGGAIILTIVVLTTLSIIGRAVVTLDIGVGPIRGIYDMTEIGMAAAIFAFLPWAQLQGTHAKVDLLEDRIPRRVNGLLELVFNVAMTAVAILIAWRLYLGMQDKLSFGETTLIAQIPVWQGYAAGLVGATGFVIVAVFCVVRSGRRLFAMGT